MKFNRLLLVLGAMLFAGPSIASQYCRAYCVSISKFPDINANAYEILSSVEVEGNSPQSLVEACKATRGIGEKKLFTTYRHYSLKAGLMDLPGRYLHSSTPATEANSCSDAENRPLMN